MSAVNHRFTSTQLRQRQTGVTLIEALIAAVILAIGILGIVSLLAMSKVSQHEAIQRTRAVALADDILERIRRNPAGMATYAARDYDAPLGGNSIDEEPDTNCASAVCLTTADMASYDLWTWENLLDGNSTIVTGTTAATAGLRGLNGCIVFDADVDRTRSGIVSIVLQWQGLRETNDPVTDDDAVCGGDDAGGDPTRRQVIIDSYIIDETEL